MVKLETSAGKAIKAFFSEKGFQGPLRIHLQSTGCCDPSLCLSVDHIQESDLIQEVDGLTFIISPETREVVGEVTISYMDEIGRQGFVITSSKPVSEWEGFGVSTIRI
jgi:Fe-S cluster assembly iron-binding protein IscA